MGTSDVMDWNLESITKRDIRVSDEVIEIMKRCNNEYLDVPASEGKAEEPSEEELAELVVKTIEEQPSEPLQYAYDDEDSVETKISNNEKKAEY